MRGSMAKMFLIYIVLSLISPQASAQDKKEELLPVPRIEAPLFFPATNLLLPPPSPPVGPRDVWQLYGVDQGGRFRPRVIYSPAGAYYLYNRQPFPWTTTRPLLYLRTIAN